jgi:hypothetical protein
MPRPTWDPTRPQDSDQVSSFPSLHRADKTTLKDIIGTLGPFGSTTTTWRQVQVGDDTWLVQNLYFDGTNWNRDDTTKASVAIGLRSDGIVTVHKVAAGSNPVGTSLPAPVATLDATSLFSALVAGTDPGGTESLRAESARLNAPVLLGSVPQFTMADDPTEALQVATKQYVDNRFPRLINDVTLSTSETTVTINLAETVGTTTPLLIVGECRFNDVDNSQVFMVVNGDTSDSYFSVWYGVGVTSGLEGSTNAARVVPRSDKVRSSFWLLWMPVTTTNRLMAGQWTSGGPSGGGVHPQWVGNAAPYSFTFLVDAGSFAAGTRFLVFRLGE